jgi:hypothetical protein
MQQTTFVCVIICTSCRRSEGNEFISILIIISIIMVIIVMKIFINKFSEIILIIFEHKKKNKKKMKKNKIIMKRRSGRIEFMNFQVIFVCQSFNGRKCFNILRNMQILLEI